MTDNTSPDTMTQRILVVDDDAKLRDLLVDFLTQHGYHVKCAADGIEMFRVLETFACDLIVLDVMLPGADGLDRARRTVFSDAHAVCHDGLLLSAGGHGLAASAWRAPHRAGRFRQANRTTVFSGQRLILAR